jgi:hypothetical protein
MEKTVLRWLAEGSPSTQDRGKTNESFQDVPFSSDSYLSILQIPFHDIFTYR